MEKEITPNLASAAVFWFLFLPGRGTSLLIVPEKGTNSKGGGREGKQWKSYRETDKKRSSEAAGRNGKESRVSEHSRAKRLVTPAEINGGTPSPHRSLH